MRLRSDFEESLNMADRGGDLLWEASTHKVTQLFEYMVTWAGVINLKHQFPQRDYIK